MGKQSGNGVLNRLSGKRVVFQGKFGWGEREQLEAMATAQGARAADDVDASTDYLVLADVSGGKTIQKKALSLNAKGASIQVLDARDFEKIAEPTQEEVLALIRRGAKGVDLFNKAISQYRYGAPRTPKWTFTGEKFDGLDLSNFNFERLAFDGCSFVGCNLNDASFSSTNNCNFTRVTAPKHVDFGETQHSVFKDADIPGASVTEPFDHADFTGAKLDGVHFYMHGRRGSIGRGSGTPIAGAVFRQASLKKAEFHDMALAAPDFEGADLIGAIVMTCKLSDANFKNAKLREANLVACKLTNADFRGADLTGASLADAELSDAKFDGADLTRCNLRGAKTKGVDFSKAKGYDPNAAATGKAGPAMKELDTLGGKAKRIEFSFRLRDESGGADAEGDEVSVDTSGLKYGWGVRTPNNIAHRSLGSSAKISDGLMLLATTLGHRKVRFETVEVQSTKSPTGGKELRELVVKAIAEAFGQAVPSEEELATATKAFRDKQREQTAAEKAQRERARKAAEKKQEAEKKQIAQKIEKEVGKVTDIATFLKALELRADKEKIKKATKMLKAEKFQLFNDVTDTYLSGVVKSQTDPDLVYACRVEADGHYACCTQNLNICGGLRGSVCKHLLVLIIGLVKAGQLDPATIDGWVAKTHDVKPELNKETMGEIFIRYKGAEAGEVDWRPTETVPEDYYAL